MNFQSLNSRKLKQSLSNKDITTPNDIKQPALNIFRITKIMTKDKNKQVGWKGEGAVVIPSIRPDG